MERTVFRCKLLTLFENYPASKFFQATTDLFYLPSLQSSFIDENLVNKIKEIALLDVPKSEFLRCYQVLKITLETSAGEKQEQDYMNKMLKGVLENHNSFASACLRLLWFSISNVV